MYLLVLMYGHSFVLATFGFHVQESCPYEKAKSDKAGLSKKDIRTNIWLIMIHKVIGVWAALKIHYGLWQFPFQVYFRWSFLCSVSPQVQYMLCVRFMRAGVFTHGILQGEGNCTPWVWARQHGRGVRNVGMKKHISLCFVQGEGEESPCAWDRLHAGFCRVQSPWTLKSIRPPVLFGILCVCNVGSGNVSCVARRFKRLWNLWRERTPLIPTASNPAS